MGAAMSALRSRTVGRIRRRTRGAPSPTGYNPHTPSSGIEQSSSDWVTTDIQVKVRDSCCDSQAVGQIGVIRSVTDKSCIIYLKEGKGMMIISSEHLEPVTPTIMNKVKVIRGKYREATGILLSIDGENGIVRMDLKKKLKTLNLRSLGKLVTKGPLGYTAGLEEDEEEEHSHLQPWQRKRWLLGLPGDWRRRAGKAHPHGDFWHCHLHG